MARIDEIVKDRERLQALRQYIWEVSGLGEAVTDLGPLGLQLDLKKEMQRFLEMFPEQDFFGNVNRELPPEILQSDCRAAR